MAASLKGIRILEMTQIMAGPTCGLLLADLGAEVIKIEKIAGGDDTRSWLPPEINGESAAFMMMNRNKKGIALNLKNKDGVEIFKTMLKNSDVVIENFRKGTLEKLGIGYDVISKINPKIILCEISGYGRTGPYAEKGGFDLVAQGMSGLMSITGESASKPPVKVGAPLTDITAGLLAVSGILAALIHRDKTGEGQKVDTSLYEAGIIHTYWQSAIAGATGQSPGPLGSAHPLTAPYQAFKTKDKWITVGASNQNTWLMLLKAIDRLDLQENQNFSTNYNRKKNLEQLVEILNKELIKKTSDEWLKIFDENGSPCGPINSIDEMFKDPQTLAREMLIEVDNKKAGKSKAIGMPIKFSKSKTEESKGAPNLGEHTKEIMKIFKYNDDQIENFYKKKVII